MFFRKYFSFTVELRGDNAAEQHHCKVASRGRCCAVYNIQTKEMYKTGTLMYLQLMIRN